MDRFVEGEACYVIDYPSGNCEQGEVVRQIDTYVKDATYYPEVYLIKFLTIYSDGSSQIITDVVNSVTMRKIK